VLADHREAGSAAVHLLGLLDPGKALDDLLAKLGPGLQIEHDRLLAPLGNLLLAEFFGGVEHYRVRLDGSNLIGYGGKDRTGKGSEVLTSDEERNLIVMQYKPVLDTAQPAYFETQFLNSEGRFLREQKLLLPLSDNGSLVNMVLAGIYYRTLG
jgi:hypothetical protein